MHKRAFFTTIAVLALSGCSNEDASTAPVRDKGAVAEAAQDDSAIELVATHAFDAPAPIANIAFTPNDVASWLGVIGMLSTDGHFYTSSVEGDKVRAISLDRHIDIIGLNRPKAPGMFLTLLEGGELRAYIESDDTNGFDEIPIDLSHSTNLEGSTFSSICAAEDAPSNKVSLIDQNNDIVTLDFTATNESLNIESAWARVGERRLETPDFCVTDSDNEPIRIFHKEDKPVSFDLYGGQNAMSISTGDYKAHLQAAIIKSPVEPVMLFTDNNSALLAWTYEVQIRTHGDEFGDLNAVNINSGLSVGGIKNARAIAATSSPFGGSGFNDGIIALADADNDRIVILSRSYLIRQVTAAAQQAE